MPKEALRLDSEGFMRAPVSGVEGEGLPEGVEVSGRESE